MSQTFGTLISDILQRTQLDSKDPKYAPLLSITTEIPDDAHRDISSGLSSLMTTDEARNNSDLHRYFKQQALNPIDTEIQRWMDDLEAPEEVKSDILGRRIATRVSAAHWSTPANSNHKNSLPHQTARSAAYSSA